MIGTANADHLEGLGGDDFLQGLGGDDLLEGGDDDDMLFGGDGSDDMHGGAGADTLSDISAGGQDKLYGDGGDDTLDVFWVGEAPVASVLLDGGEGNDSLSVDSAQAIGQATLTGGEGKDAIVLLGEQSIDQATLLGGGDDDVIESILFGGGNADIDAGSGADRVVVRGFGVHYVVTLGTGADTLRVLAPSASLSVRVTDFEVGDNGDRLDLLRFFHAVLTGWDQITNPFASGHLRLVQSGADTLVQIDRDGAGPLAFETLLTLQNVTKGALTTLNLGDLPQDGSKPAGRTIVGDASANAFWGTLGNDTMLGLGGNDRLEAYAGDDLIDGGDGNDTLIGGFGNDTLIGGAGADSLQGGEGSDVLRDSGDFDQLAGGKGNDTYLIESPEVFIEEREGEGTNDAVFTSVSYALASGQEIETLSTLDWTSTAALNLTGNEIANSLFGNAGANVLNGGAGADAMYGMGGNDTYIVDDAGDQVLEAAGGGANDIVFSSVSYTLASGQEIETLSALDWNSTAALNFTGNGIANTLFGNAGANVLDGGGGADALYGLGGNDVYFVDNVGDVAIESADGGSNDRVFTTVSYTLAAGQEVETLSTLDWGSIAALNLTGNGIANTLFGNAGANVLDGGAGADALYGQSGADVFAFTTTLGGGNADLVGDFLSGTDKIGLDDGIFSGIGTPGSFNANAFFAGAAAHDLDDRIVYDQATGRLFYDADGSGAGAQMLFATIAGAPVLTASDFQVI